MASRLIAILVALLLAVPVVRNAGVAAFADRSPGAAAKFWPKHPAAEISLGLTEIGRAARARKPVPTTVFSMINDAAAKAPLAPEPFLVRGVQAAVEGKTVAAIASFEQAELRDPRSLAARYFLADAYFRAGDTRNGLREILALSRLAPHGVDTLAPYVSLYARNRATWPQLRELFRSDANLEDASLSKLATDAGNAETVLALADWGHVVPGTAWLPTLVNSLVARGQYERARSLWARQWKVDPQPGQAVFNPGFSNSKAATPFNWELVSSSLGLAEGQPGGRLHIIFYGQEDGMLARQLLVLQPGIYALSMRVAGAPARAQSLHWSVRCDKTDKPLAAVGLDTIGRRPLTFTVPPGCPAQWLELSGVSRDIAQQIDATIDSLQLKRAPSDG